MRSLESFNIGNFEIGERTRPFIVAEMSGNHNQSLQRALELVDAAASSGAHAVKLQTYTPDTMTLDVKSGPFVIQDPKSLWYGRNLYDLYKEAATPYEWHKPIFDRCRERNIICFSTPFDETAVDFLESLNVPCYKIASFENTDIPLIRKVAATGKPLIISSGMASLSELAEAISTAKSHGAKNIILLKCTSTYPANPSDSNIATIPHMRETFDVHVGLSDHTMGIGVSVASVALGSIFIEKHFTLRRSDGGVDSTFSIEPDELKALVLETERAWQSFGKIKYVPTSQEEKSKQFRRTIRVKRDLPAGHRLSIEDIAIVRPSGGLEPKFLNMVLGKKLLRKVEFGHAINWDDFME